VLNEYTERFEYYDANLDEKN
jgi:hypothetical protein